VKTELRLEGGELLMGNAVADIGHLAGRNGRKYPWSPWGEKWKRTAKPVEWLVKAKPGASGQIIIHSEKGGKQIAEVIL
jgi:hypothetical protein